MNEQSDLEWQRLVGEITSGMKEWAQQHPQASLAEIERETMRRMAELQARMMEDILRARAAEARAGEAERVMCPECGREMEYRGEQEKRLQAQGGGEVMLKRGYAVCPGCGAGFFPPG
jgi:hypothetical protein